MVATSSIRSTIFPELLVSSGVASESVYTQFVVLFEASAEMSVSIIDQRSYLLVDNAVMSATAMQKLFRKELIADTALMSTSLPTRMRDLIVDDAVMEASAIQYRITSLLGDSAAAFGSILAGMQVRELIVDASVMSAYPLLVMRDLIVNTVAMTAAILPGLRVRDLIVDAAAMSVQMFHGLTTGDLLVASMAMSAAAFGSATARDLIADEAVMEAGAIDAIPMTAWSAPTDSFAMSRYNLLSLNSVATVGGYLIAFGPVGAFRRSGLTDDGAAIDAYVRTGADDFGDPKPKRQDTMYVTHTSSTTARVQTTENGTGQSRTFSYEVPQRQVPPTAPVIGRCKLGRGVESRYYQFTFRNKAGGSLNLTGLMFDYLPLSRNF